MKLPLSSFAIVNNSPKIWYSNFVAPRLIGSTLALFKLLHRTRNTVAAIKGICCHLNATQLYLHFGRLQERPFCVQFLFVCFLLFLRCLISLIKIELLWLQTWTKSWNCVFVPVLPNLQKLNFAQNVSYDLYMMIYLCSRLHTPLCNTNNCHCRRIISNSNFMMIVPLAIFCLFT